MALFGSKKEESAPPAPPIPPVPPKAANTQSLEEKPEITEGVESLSPPPIPGGSLAEIKNQVSQKEEKFEEDTLEKSSNTQDLSQESDSLFDLEELNFPEVSEDINSHENNFEEPEVENKYDAKENISDEKLSFLKHTSNKRDIEETYFITTKDFKNLLEIVESVKNKVKEANETHLRLLDIKAEEDIEYENLRKDFQYIEDKLYEVDSLIFEK